MSLRVEAIGAGTRALGDPDPSVPNPSPFGSDVPIGQHLRVERLVRITEERLLYLANNIGPKWSRRKCWACGNKYSPNTAQCCTYCRTPLQDLRFLISARWRASRYKYSH